MRQKCSSTEQGGLLPIFSKTEKQQEQQEQEQQRCPPASHLPFQPITALAALCSVELCHPQPLVLHITLKPTLHISTR